MYSVRVIPLARGVLRDHLTFFSRTAVPAGSVVSAPVRARTVPALVVSCIDVREDKLDLRAAGFALKKLTDAEPRKILSSAFMRAVVETARYHGAHEGAVASALTFTPILAAQRSVEEVQEPTRTAEVTPEVLVLQAEVQERLSAYRNLARESFARGRSLMIVVPSLIELEEFSDKLGRGIGEQVLTFSSDIGAKKLRERWNKVVSSTTPLLVIGTPAVLSVPLIQPDTIVVERESARSYKGRERPHLDVRLAAEYLAREVHARLILADFPVRVETRYRVEAHRAEDLARPQQRPAGSAEVVIVDTRTKDELKKERRGFSPITHGTLETIVEAAKHGGNSAVFAARRGVAPMTVCNDCGTPVTDKATGTPMILHKTPKGNVFISHRSGALLPANTACTTCGGWNLVTLGIGVDRVYDEIKKRHPELEVMLLTQETAPTHRAARKIAQAFYETRGAVMVGTERMLPYLMSTVAVCAVASIDSFLSSSAWRANEHSLSILMYLRARSEQKLLVETRKPEHEVIKTLVSGSPSDFYRREIDERKEYGYPPFAVFIGLSWTGTPAAAAALHKTVTKTFSEEDIVGPLPPESLGRNRILERAVIRVPAGEWPDDALIEKLTALPPGVSVTVDPDILV